MAITITDQPYVLTPLGQKLIVVATSDNTAENGFKYKAVINLEFPETVAATLYISPNPSGAMILDLAPFIRLNNTEVVDDVAIHAFIDGPYYIEDLLIGGSYVSINVDLYEAWIVDGVLTDDPDAEGAESLTSGKIIFNGTYQASDGYKPDPSVRFCLDGTTQNWLSDRRWNTHAPPGELGPIENTKVYIPVREADYGVLSLLLMFEDGNLATQIGVTIFDALGAPNSFTIDLADAVTLNQVPLYPANLNDSVEAGWEKPSDFPGWRYIQIRAETALGAAVVSVNYILYNTAVFGVSDCRFDPVRLAWKNSAGGWDYFNFTKRNQITNNIESKRYHKVLGDYDSETFSIPVGDRGLTETDKIVEQTLDATSDWLQENEFVFLRGLFVSKQVHWLQDDGTFIPVVVEDTGFTEQRGRNSKQVNQSIKLKLANEYWT